MAGRLSVSALTAPHFTISWSLFSLRLSGGPSGNAACLFWLPLDPTGTASWPFHFGDCVGPVPLQGLGGSLPGCSRWSLMAGSWLSSQLGLELHGRFCAACKTHWLVTLSDHRDSLLSILVFLRVTCPFPLRDTQHPVFTAQGVK